MTKNENPRCQFYRLNIALYFFRLGDSEGGAERMLLHLAGALAKRGHNIHIVSWDNVNAQAFHPLQSNVVWHRLGFHPGWRDKLRRTFILSKLLRSIRCQVFVGFVMSSDKTVYTACLLSRTPIVVAERNSPEMYKLKYNRLVKAFYMGLFAFARRVVLQINDYRKDYPAWLQKRIDVIPNPVNTAKTKAKPGTPGNNGWTLLSVARLEYQKNLEVLVQAFSGLANEFTDWNLRLVGEGRSREKLERLITELDMTDRVTLTGAISNIENEYKNSHLFCLPSRWEGFPNAMAEAMAHGLPVVGFADCPGVNSIIDEGVDGMLAPGNGDANSLKYCLKNLMADSEKRSIMGQKAARLSRRFNPENIIDQWEQLLIKLV